MTRFAAMLALVGALLAGALAHNAPAYTDNARTVPVPAPAHVVRVVPACEEDEVLVGVGEFESGRWSAYRCGPAADDFGTLFP